MICFLGKIYNWETISSVIASMNDRYFESSGLSVTARVYKEEVYDCITIMDWVTSEVDK